MPQASFSPFAILSHSPPNATPLRDDDDRARCNRVEQRLSSLPCLLSHDGVVVRRTSCVAKKGGLQMSPSRVCQIRYMENADPRFFFFKACTCCTLRAIRQNFPLPSPLSTNAPCTLCLPYTLDPSSLAPEGEKERVAELDTAQELAKGNRQERRTDRARSMHMHIYAVELPIRLRRSAMSYVMYAIPKPCWVQGGASRTCTVFRVRRCCWRAHTRYLLATLPLHPA